MASYVMTPADFARTQLDLLQQSQELMLAARMIEAAAYGLAGNVAPVRVSHLILMAAELERFAQGLTVPR